MSDGGAFKRLRALGDEALQRIDEQLLGGESAPKVASWIKAQGWLTEMSDASLKKMLDRYRNQDLRPRTIERVSAASRHTPVAVLHKRLNAMEGLAELITTQQERLGALRARELQLPAGMLLKDFKHEARLLKDALVDLGRLQLETGILVKAPRKLTGTITGADGEVHEFAWTTEQEQLYELLEGDFEVLEGLEDGT